MPRIPPPPRVAAEPISPWRLRWRMMLRRPIVILGGLILIGLFLTAALAPLLAPANPQRMEIADRLKPPSAVHPLGTDDFGRDVFSRVLYGIRLSLAIGTAVVVISTTIGLPVGLAAGYMPRLDNPLMRLMDALMAFPAVILAIALMAALGPSAVNVAVALGIVYSPRMARIIRGSVLVVREFEYVTAARSLGLSDAMIMARHVLPNCMSPAIVQGTFIFAYAVLGEALLSFLGAGVPPHIPSLGTILSGGRVYMGQAPWITVFPGLAIMLLVIGLNLFGDGLRDAFDPRLLRGGTA
ncbi:MAG: ABC transporter permease [bacterium]|nr:ABC transporter permease [bacterium]